MDVIWLGGEREPTNPKDAAGPATPAAGGLHPALDRDGELGYLQQRIDRLELVCEAMWKLLKEKTKAGDDELALKVRELDLSDGKADGKVSRGPVECPNCGKPNSRRRLWCIYCGQPIRGGVFG